MQFLAAFLVIFLGAGYLSPVSVSAQELTPRAYWPTPQGTHFLSVGYTYVSGDTIPDPTLPISAVDSEIHTALLGSRRTFSLLGRTANLAIELPYSDGETSARGDLGRDRQVDYDGLGDVAATLAVNFVGAPSLTQEDFAELRRNPHPILGGSLKLVAPTGDYDSDKAINVGSNRWAFKMETGYIQPLKPQWLLELEAGVWFFTDNDDFLGVTREQDPIYSFDLHLVRRFSRGFWGSLDASAYRGGRSKVDGERLDDLQRDTKVGFTFLIPFLVKNAIKFSYSNGSLNDSGEDFDEFLVSYQRLL